MVVHATFGAPCFPRGAGSAELERRGHGMTERKLRIASGERGPADTASKGSACCILIGDGYEAFFHVVYPCFWSADEDKAMLAKAILGTAADAGAAGILPLGTGPEGTVEMVCAPDASGNLPGESLKTLSGIIRRFLAETTKNVKFSREELEAALFSPVQELFPSSSEFAPKPFDETWNSLFSTAS